MRRREVLRILGRMAALPALSRLSLDQLYDLGRETHRRLDETPLLRILDLHQHETATAVAELIIPQTDTPGARAARVSEFIDLLLAEWCTAEERTRFLDGLADLDRRSQATGGRAFIEAEARQQVNILSQLEARWLSLKAAGGKPEEDFFHQIKYFTVYGYYTSRVGVEQELHWVAIPGRYDPCLATGIRKKGSS
jgi:hypothetical protein